MVEILNLLNVTFYEFLVKQRDSLVSNEDEIEKYIQEQVGLFKEFLKETIELIQSNQLKNKQMKEIVQKMEQFLKTILLDPNDTHLSEKIKQEAIQNIIFKCQTLLNKKILKNYVDNLKDSILNNESVQQASNLRIYAFNDKEPILLMPEFNSINNIASLCEENILNKKYSKLTIIGNIDDCDTLIKTIECPMYRFKEYVIREPKEESSISKNKKQKMKKETTGIRVPNNYQSRMYH